MDVKKDIIYDNNSGKILIHNKYTVNKKKHFIITELFN